MSKSMSNTSAANGLSELKRRLLFVIVALIVFRIGSYIPVPGIDPQKLSAFFNQHGSGIIGMFNMFSGGALQRFTILALGIMPYISASIIVQLLSAVTPSLAELKKEGESGQRKINQYIRYGTLFLAFFQALGVSKGLASQGVTIAQMPGFTFYFVATVSLVTGTMFLMWLGEQITERGVGNGISLIIFAGIVSGLPSAIGKTFEQVREGQMQFIVLLLLVAVVVIVMGFVVFIERGQRRITINYAKRQVGKKIYPSQTSHLPLKINMSGVIPPIFASSIIMFPATIAQFMGQSHGWTWLSSVGVALQVGQPIYMIVFSLAVVFFCFFYTSLVFNPKDTADNLKRSGAFIPGIRPGEQTANYIDSVMSRLTLFGAFYVVLVCLLPQLLVMTWNVPFYFGGTSLLIIIVVVMDFIAQIQAHLMSYQYESLMKKSDGKSGFSLLN